MMKGACIASSICLTVSVLIGSMQAQQPIFAGCEETVQLPADGQLPADLDQDLVAQIARCHVRHQDNMRAALWYETIADRADCKPEYLLAYGQTLKSQKLYGKAKYYFQKYAQYDPVVGNQFVQSCDVARMILEGEPMYAVSRVPANTSGSECAPSILGEQLTYCTISAAGTQRQTHALADWSTSANGQKGFSGAHMSADRSGKYVVYGTAGFVAGERLVPGSAGRIFVTEAGVNGQWSQPRQLYFGGIDYNAAYPALTADGMTIYFASNRPGGFGGWDLYLSHRTGDAWSLPVNLGPEINTPGDEISPFAAKDILYFSSDWHTGLGGFDIFRARVGHDDHFDGVTPVGYPVNSEKDDLDFVWDEMTQTAYFVSNRIGGIGSYDLYKAIPEYTELEVKVIDKVTMKPLEHVMLAVVPGISRPTYTDVNGAATFRRTFTSGSAILAQKEGFIELQTPVNEPGDQDMLTMQVYMEPIPAPAPVAEKKAEPKPASVAPAVSGEAPVSRPAPVVNKTHEPTATASPASTRSADKFFVQIAALARNSDVTAYSGLRRYGDLVVHDDEKYSRVRVGTFDTEEQAKVVLERIREGGYPDAFVVKYEVPVNTSPAASKVSAEYKVRLATYSQVGNFDPTRVEHLGTIESYRKDEMTIMLLSGFHSLDAAREAQEAAVRQGFKDAYVVMDNGGVLERVR